MPQTIYGNQVASELLRADLMLTVTVNAGPGAIVEQLFAGAVVQKTAISTSTTFGPFLDDMTFRISTLNGCTVSTTQSVQIAQRNTDTKQSANDALVSTPGISAAPGTPDSRTIWSPSDDGVDYIARGCQVPAAGTIGIAAVRPGVVVMDGKRVAFPGAVPPLEPTSDNYIDLTPDAQLVVTAVAVGGAPPIKHPAHLRLGASTTNSTSVTARITGADATNGIWMRNITPGPHWQATLSPSTVYTAGDRALPFASGVIYDNDAMHSETTLNTRIYAQRPGLLLPSATVIIASGASTQQWRVKVYKNGVNASLGSMSADAATVLSQTAGGKPIPMEDGDYFEFFFENTGTLTVAGYSATVTKVG